MQATCPHCQEPECIRPLDELDSAACVLGVNPDGAPEKGTPPDLTEHDLSIFEVMARIVGHELRHLKDTARGTFPKPHRRKFDGQSLWRESEIQAWIDKPPRPVTAHQADRATTPATR